MAQFYVHELKVWWAVVAGVLLGQVISRITEYYTSTETSPVAEIAESTRTGPATTILSGIGVGPGVVGGRHPGHHRGPRRRRGPRGRQHCSSRLYLVSLIGIGLLSTTGIVVSQDTFGPVSDNAAGIAEMSGEFEGEPEKIMVSLDAVGNTTKAITKGVAIGSAVIAAVALFGAFIQTIIEQLGLKGPGTAIYEQV